MRGRWQQGQNQGEGRFAGRRFLRLLALGLLLALSVPCASYAGCDEDVCNGDTIVKADVDAAKANQFKQRVAQAAETLKVITSILNWIPKFVSSLTEKGDALIGKEQRDVAIDTANSQLVIALKAKMYDARTKDDFLLGEIDETAKIAAGSTLHDAGSNALCHTIHARQLVPVMRRWASMIQSYSLDMWTAEKPGVGPLYLAAEADKKCGRVNENDPVTGAAGSSCPGEPLVLLAPGVPVSFQRAGTSVELLSPGKAVLKIPVIESKQVEQADGSQKTTYVFKAREGDYQQQAWIAAYDVCARAQGPRPDLPEEAKANTPTGMALATGYGVCMAKSSMAATACFGRLSWMTRPDCKQDLHKEFCKYAKEACQAAVSSGMALDESYENCENGLSYYEMMTLSASLCATETRQAEALALGVMQGDLLSNGQSACTKVRTKWREWKAKEEKLFMASMGAARDVQQCWAGLGK